MFSSSDPTSLGSSYSSPHARSSSNDSSLQDGKRTQQQQAPLPSPPSFLPSMFHMAWREAMEEVSRSSTSPPPSPEQQVQNLQEEVRQLVRYGGLKRGSKDSRARRRSSNAPSTDTGNQSERRAAAQDVSRPISRWPWISWAMVGWTGVLFWKQWQPLLPILLSATQQPEEWVTRAAAVCLVVPDTPAALDWQMNVLDFVSGNWKAALAAAFLHSGLIPTLVFTKGLLEVSTLLEESFGPAVLALQAMASAIGAAVLQTMLLPASHTICGPAVVCGLYAGLAVHISRTRQLAKQVAQQAGREMGSYEEGSKGDVIDVLSDDEQEGAISTRMGYTCGIAAVLLGLYQPMLGVWGILGGMLGGVLAALSMPWVMAALQSTLLFTLVLVHRVWGFARSIPRLLITSVIGLGRAVYLFAVELIKAVRQV